MVSDAPALYPPFAAFRESHWLKPDGACISAPWLDDTFARRLDERLRAALGKEQFARAWLLAAAAEQLGASPLLASPELALVAAISASATSPTSWLAARPPLRHALAHGGAQPTPAWRVRVFLAALRPHGETFADDEADELLDAVDLAAPALRATILGLFAIAAAGLDPIARVRDELEGAVDGKKLKKRVDTAKKALSAELERLTATFDATTASAAAVDLAAWAGIAADVTAVVAPLLAESAGAPPAALAARLVELAARCRAALAELSPRLHPRTVAYRAVRRAIDSAAAAAELVRKLDANGQPARHTPAAPLAELRALLGAVTPLARAEEELCVHLLDRQLAAKERQGGGDPLWLTLADVCACPELLALVPAVDADTLAEGHPGVVAHVADLDPVRAAAALLGRDDADPPPLAKLRPQLIAARRDDLLAGLAAALPPDERAWLADAKAGRVARIRARSEQRGGADAVAAHHLVADDAIAAADLALLEAWLSNS